MYNIMLIEDDMNLCEKIKKSLLRWGFSVYTVEDFSRIDMEFAKLKPHLVIMDINLPYYDGFYWCKRIRDISMIPVLFLSSRDMDSDVIMAVNLGADDYITKPFSMNILVAKINALIRRTYNYGEVESHIIECTDFFLDLGKSHLIYKDEHIELTRNELKILNILIRHKGNIVSRDKIMRELWDDDTFINDNTLTVNVNRLRIKLKEMGLEDIIQTKKGQGYLIK